MTELTREQLIEEVKLKIAIAKCHPNSGVARVEGELFKIALASLEAEPIAYIFKHPAGKLFWALTDESNKEQADVIPVYAAPPVPVIQADVAQAIENLKQKLVECNRYNYCADAVKGVEDACLAAMRHGPEPVSQTCKLPSMSSNEVNDAAWKLHNMLTEHDPLNGRQFNNLKGCFYEALKVAMRNYPVTPDG
ncbi:DUF551 domain-containing protein [Escherichia albertii]|uniref:DUF551 domain-containing protein n=1 Tax=Escherichia albertii TaxID=208962 RepID=UPI003CC63575